MFSWMQDKVKVISEAAVNNILFLISIAKEEAKKIGENFCRLLDLRGRIIDGNGSRSVKKMGAR